MILAAGAVMNFAVSALELQQVLPTGPCTDVAGNGTLAVAVGGGNLFTIDVSDPADVRILGRLDGLGDTRQVALRGNLALVASRIDGLFIVKIENPAKPQLLSHYDTLEKATGIAVSGNIAYVANRFYGVEAIDISDPARPQFISSFLEKHEVQSVAYGDNRLYAGVWAERKVIAYDVQNPRQPRRLGEIALDGYGDGVAVRGNLVLAATGHHAANYPLEHYLPRAKDAKGYGAGHGLEVIDFSGMLPVKQAVLKTPAYYRGVPDFWSVDFGAGSRALLCDAHNGVAVIDLADLANPKIISRWTIPVKDPAVPEAVGGAAIGNGVVLAAGTESNLYVLNAQKEIAFAPLNNPQMQNVGEPVAPAACPPFEHIALPGLVRQILPLNGNYAAVAAGDAGLLVLDLRDNRWQRYPAVGFVRHLTKFEDKLIVAEMHGGGSVWQIGVDGKLVLLSRQTLDEAVLQVETPSAKPYLLVEAGIREFRIYDISDLNRWELKLKETGPGLFYGPQIAGELFFGKYAAVFWHHGGPYWYDVGSDTPVRVNEVAVNVNQNVAGNLVRYGDLALLMTNNGYLLAGKEDLTSVAKLPRQRLAGKGLNGLATVWQNRLITVNPAWKILRVIAVAPDGAPTLVKQYELPGMPGAATVIGDKLYVPDGRDGLLVAPLAELAK